MGVLPKWLALPVEHRCLTAEEANIILSLASLGSPPARMSEEDLAAVLKLQHWTALVMMETEGVIPS